MTVKKDKDWYKKNTDRLTRGSELWDEFVSWQKQRILERLERYNNKDTAKTQLQEWGDLTPYQHYKIKTVSKFLMEALDRMAAGKYGICKECNNEIPAKRLLLVPGSLRCVSCTEKFTKKLNQ